MAIARTQQEIFWPPPIQGMITENNYVQGPVEFARFLRNAVITPGSIRQRHEQQKLSAEITPVANHVITWSDYAENQYLWSNGQIRQANGTVLYSTSFSDVPTYEGSFQNQLFLSLAGVATAQRNAGTWGAFNYTLATLTSSEIAGSVSYKGRAFFWGVDATDSAKIIEYGGLRAITGPTTPYDITAFLKEDEIIQFCKVPTLEAGLQTGQVFVVFGNLGSVLVFDGDNPSSWVLSSRFTMTKPLSRHSWVEIEGDVIIMGTEYIYSMRALFASGSQAAAANALTRPIQKLYQSIAALAVEASAADPKVVLFGHYLKVHDALIFALGYANNIMESDTAEWPGGPFRRLQAVYFRQAQAWALWDIPQFNWPVRTAAISVTGVTRERDVWSVYRRNLIYDTSGTSAAQDSFEVPSLGVSDPAQSQVEFVWTTPILIGRSFLNAQILGVRLFAYMEVPGSGDDIGAGVSALGVIGDGEDLGLQALTEGTPLFRRDDNVLVTKKSTNYIFIPDSTDKVYQFYASVGLQEFFHSTTMRFNKLLRDPISSETFPSANWLRVGRVEVYGMTTYFQPGGIF